jgi:hypothetical protein
MSLPDNKMDEIKQSSEKGIGTEMADNKGILAAKKKALEQEEELLFCS